VGGRSDRRNSFDRFVAEHGRSLAFLAFKLCGDRQRGEDAVQEALARVYRRWRHLEDPVAYARLAVVNATRDDWRRSTRRDRAETSHAALPVAPAADIGELIVQRDQLRRALDALAPRQRAVVVLRYWVQLTEAETARSLDISVGTVKSQTADALARLRRELGGDLVTTAIDLQGEA
jgi:RNA polymerase sigma-70 factor (sigma-E family)